VVGCAAAKCGDGVVQAGVEECDDGNVNEEDGCDNAVQAGVDAGRRVRRARGLPWGDDPPTFTCKEACAQIFGGEVTDYACSTTP
jgi:cysteine-rich repeat protein